MANIKHVSITEGCTLCGLCEQDMYSEVFQKEKTTIAVLQNGLIDVDKYSFVLELRDLCPVSTIQVDDEVSLLGDNSDILSKLNDKVYRELRDYSFAPPKYKTYEYKQGIYSASKIPANYRSEEKYRTYESAEDAGIRAFEKSVWPQRKDIARQYAVAYKLRCLKQFYAYEENGNNYYYAKNQEIKERLEETYRLAVEATSGAIMLPDDFCSFDVKPEFGWATETLETLEMFPFNFESSGFYHTLDSYRTYVNIDGDDKYYYDFEAAERELRDDMDYIMSEIMERLVPQLIESATDKYCSRAERLLKEKVDLLQRELKKCIVVDQKSTLVKEIKRVYDTITNTQLPQIEKIRIEIDTNYNSDYRFRSKSSCIDAANNRRDRAHDEAGGALGQVPARINEAYMSAMAQIATSWKREIMSAYDISGLQYPETVIDFLVGHREMRISLCDFEGVQKVDDLSIKKHIEEKVLMHGSSLKYGYAIEPIYVNDVYYMKKNDCEIVIREDYDLKDTLFGGLKEVNHRYGYQVWLSEFESSAQKVCDECIAVFSKSQYLIDYFEKVKRALLSQLQRVTGVYYTSNVKQQLAAKKSQLNSAKVSQRLNKSSASFFVRNRIRNVIETQGIKCFAELWELYIETGYELKKDIERYLADNASFWEFDDPELKAMYGKPDGAMCAYKMKYALNNPRAIQMDNEYMDCLNRWNEHLFSD